MEWTECLKKSIQYIEKHLLEDIGINEIGDAVNVSPFYFQKGFKIMTGITIAEYIRNRRLYLAALDIIAGKIKVIDLAYKYGYDSPESFSKAFSRFHGISPAQLKGDSSKIKAYLPLKISISIKGGNTMDYVVESMKGFKIIGFERRIELDSSYEKIPEFWNEFSHNCKKKNYSDKIQEIIEKNMVGEYGICISDKEDEGGFRYLIAGSYLDGEIPDGMTVVEIPEMEWVKFRCVGPLPGALQAINSQIFEEWLPGNSEYEIAGDLDVEWYSMGDCSSQNYESAIWIPVKRK